MKNSVNKYGSNYQECAHAFAHAFAHADKNESGENYGNRMFFSSDIIYSYGYHFIMAKKIRSKKYNSVDFVLFNSDNYSNTTTKQQYALRRALYQKIINVSTNIEFFKPLNEIKEQEKIMLRNAKLYSRARSEHTKYGYMANISIAKQTIIFFAEYYRLKSKIPSSIKKYLIEGIEDIELLKLLGIANVKKIKSEARSKAKAEKIQKERTKKERAQEIENLENWKAGEGKRIYLKFDSNDYLRIVKESKEIETTQGVKISIQEAKRLLKLIDSKKIIGAIIDEKYTVNAFNGFLKVGCHNINTEEINAIRSEI